MKRFPVLVAAAALVATTAACSSGSGSTGAAAPAPTPSGAAELGAAPTSAAPTSAAPTSEGTTSSAAPSSSATPGASDRCYTADLKLTLGGGDAAAGTQHVNLVFTNKSKRTCTLYGYPGVSWVTGDQGTQVNDPFQREAPGSRKKVTLKPSGAAHAVLVTHTAENYDTAKCKPIKVRGLRIYPPDETAAVFVDDPGTACSMPGVNLAQVDPITTGA